MPDEKLFGANIQPACKYCERAVQFAQDLKLFCEKCGAVDETGKCRHFVYDPLKRVPRRPRPLQRIKETEFVL
jgi:hypothetical protein